MNSSLGAAMPSVDLSNCEREPIHTPGHLQPHGLLLAADPQSLTIIQWSINALAALQLSADELRNRPLRDVMDAGSLALVEQLVSTGTPALSAPLQTVFRSQPESGMHLGTAHIFDGVLILEFEVKPVESALLHSTVEDKSVSITRCIQLATARLYSSRSLAELYRALAEEVRRLSGFDRVMIYRFMPDDHGVVEGEALREGLESYLGLHYPATDIPPQARRLYTLNMLRVIADVNAQAVPIEPPNCPVHGRPLDLTYSAFRSVSPIHIEYLQNMGVAASMSISILNDGRLWGLIACHHYEPREVSLEIRAACELLGTMAGCFVVNRQISDERAEHSGRQEKLAEAIRTLASIDSIRAGLATIAPELQKAIDAHGIAICWRDEIMLQGHTPPQELVSRLHQHLASTLSRDVWSTDFLSEHYAAARQFVDVASGAMVLHLGLEPADMLIFFRPQYETEVHWGGNPEKTAELSEDGVRLSPRKSFAKWTETVRFHSRPWSRVDRVVAADMQAGLVRLLAQRSAELLRVNEELMRINADLDSFAYAASHDLKEPLRTISQTTYFLERALGEHRNQDVQRRIRVIHRTTERMADLLEGLLRVSRAGSSDLRLEPTQLADVVRDAAEIALAHSDQEKIDLVVHPLPNAMVDFMCLRDVFQNLFSNARKYSTRTEKRIEVGTVTVGTEHGGPPRALGRTAIYVRDNGIGIASRRLQDVFQVFRRLHQAGEYGGGSGVGLAIVKRVVERHGGMVWAQSEPGEGSTFFFTLEAILQ